MLFSICTSLFKIGRQSFGVNTYKISHIKWKPIKIKIHTFECRVKKVDLCFKNNFKILYIVTYEIMNGK